MEERTSRIFGIWGASFGLCATTTESTLFGFMPCSAKKRHHIRQELTAVGASIRLVRVGKVRADVAQGRRAEQRVDDRVDQRIGVGVSAQTPLVGNLHTAEYQLAIRLEPVDVIAYADANQADIPS